MQYKNYIRFSFWIFFSSSFFMHHTGHVVQCPASQTIADVVENYFILEIPWVVHRIDIELEDRIVPDMLFIRLNIYARN